MVEVGATVMVGMVVVTVVEEVIGVEDVDVGVVVVVTGEGGSDVFYTCE